MSPINKNLKRKGEYEVQLYDFSINEMINAIEDSVKFNVESGTSLMISFFKSKFGASTDDEKNYKELSSSFADHVIESSIKPFANFKNCLENQLNIPHYVLLPEDEAHLNKTERKSQILKEIDELKRRKRSATVLNAYLEEEVDIGQSTMIQAQHLVNEKEKFNAQNQIAKNIEETRNYLSQWEVEHNITDKLPINLSRNSALNEYLKDRIVKS